MNTVFHPLSTVGYRMTPEMLEQLHADRKRLCETFPIGASVEFLGIKGVILEHNSVIGNIPYGVLWEYHDQLSNGFTRKWLGTEYLRILNQFKITNPIP